MASEVLFCFLLFKVKSINLVPVTIGWLTVEVGTYLWGMVKDKCPHFLHWSIPLSHLTPLLSLVSHIFSLDCLLNGHILDLRERIQHKVPRVLPGLFQTQACISSLQKNKTKVSTMLPWSLTERQVNLVKWPDPHQWSNWTKSWARNWGKQGSSFILWCSNCVHLGMSLRSVFSSEYLRDWTRWPLSILLTLRLWSWDLSVK